MATYHQISNTIWNIANHLRGGWKPHEYQDVILPLTVLKRLDAVLEPTKQKVLERYNELHGRVDNLSILCRITGYNFYNISPFTFKKLLDDPTYIARNLGKYIDGFSPNVKEIFEKFEFHRQLERLHGSNILYLILQEFDKIDLHPELVPNHIIGLAFEDLIRRFAEQSNETAGEHYTPRDVVRLMAALIFTGEEKELSKPGKIITIYDPACGTGGMLTVGSDYVKNNINPNIKAFLFGQELNPVTYAICKADILLQNEDKDPEGIKGGDKEHDKASTLTNDQHADQKFDYIISNPPYGVEWKKDKSAVEHENARGFSGRFGAGLPRISDGQFLFIQHAISKFKPESEGGSDAVIITNGSPLFTGDAGQGESEIRRWILEKDYLDAIIALPDQLFFNTGIPTYVWVFTNRKPAERKNKVQLVDARKRKSQLRKNLGEKRYEISEAQVQEILEDYGNYKVGETVKIFDTSEFGYRAVTIQRPLRLKFEITKEAIEKVKNNKEFLLDNPSKKKGGKGAEENKLWQELRSDIYKSLEALISKLYMSRTVFLEALENEYQKRPIKVPARYTTLIWKEIGKQDDEAEICTDENGNPEPNNDLKDVERIPLTQDIYEYFRKEVNPYMPDAWIDETVKDEKDTKVGKVGYEIPFAKYFYKFLAPREPKEIQKDIENIDLEIVQLMSDFSFITQTKNEGVVKSTGIRWIGDIPKEWKMLPTRSLFTTKKELVEKNFTDYKLLSLSINGVRPRDSESTGKNPSDYESYQVFYPNDLVFCLFDYDVTPRTIGHVLEKGILTGAYTRLVPKYHTNSRYYYYLFLYLDQKKELLHLCTGLRNSLSKYVFWPLKNPSPSFEDQKQIVNFLDDKTKKVDRTIEKMLEKIEKLKEYKTSLIYSAVTGKIKIQ